MDIDEALLITEHADYAVMSKGEIEAAKVLANEVQRLRERADSVRAELTKAKELTRRGGIPVAALVGLQLAVLCLDGEA